MIDPDACAWFVEEVRRAAADVRQPDEAIDLALAGDDHQVSSIVRWRGDTTGLRADSEYATANHTKPRGVIAWHDGSVTSVRSWLIVLVAVTTFGCGSDDTTRSGAPSASTAPITPDHSTTTLIEVPSTAESPPPWTPPTIVSPSPPTTAQLDFSNRADPSSQVGAGCWAMFEVLRVHFGLYSEELDPQRPPPAAEQAQDIVIDPVGWASFAGEIHRAAADVRRPDEAIEVALVALAPHRDESPYLDRMASEMEQLRRELAELEGDLDTARWDELVIAHFAEDLLRSWPDAAEFERLAESDPACAFDRLSGG